jgi:hypothetical protein
MTYPVSPSTVPWLEALTKLTPLGSAEATRRSVSGAVPGFFTVYVKLTGSPTSAALGATELVMEISGAHGLTSPGACCAPVKAAMTKL